MNSFVSIQVFPAFNFGFSCFNDKFMKWIPVSKHKFALFDLLLFFFPQKVFKMLEGSDESVIAADDMRLAMANAFVVSI